ncbi:MAG: phenylalanine--tRNA ligase subunit beta [Nitrospirae bacterium]|nr:phenylalanine--tRNA ligase subunit beta [Nitrospirota bacterium]
MPTISIKKKDLETLIGLQFSLNDLERHLQLVKGELKGYVAETDEMRVELSDSNRPDLWCCEGIARQIKGKLTGAWKDYEFFYSDGTNKIGQIVVSEDIRDIRPYVGGFAATGIPVDEEMLVQMIQTQEKISEVFGSKRRRISIGIYNLAKIKFPVYYKAVRPEDISFAPLGFDEKMNLQDIVERHPKGETYGEILRGMAKYPILIDSKDNVLSFPPIINSREVGEVKVGDTELFVEVTGIDIRLVLLILNVLAVNLHDRGANINIAEVLYPYETEFGKTICIPNDFTEPLPLPLKDIDKVIGEGIDIEEVITLLDSYGHWVKRAGDELQVTPPPYRDDIMHPVDLCEDIAISRGYSSFNPVMPSQMTVGVLSDAEVFADQIREYIIGSGFQEIISNILTSKEDVLYKMGLEQEKVVEVDNIMSQSYSALRQWLIPSLLRVETASSESFYPHKIFEMGEAAVSDETSNLASRTVIKCAAMMSHPAANFSEIHSILETLMYYLQMDYRLVPGEHPSFIGGRMGWIYTGKDVVGLIGEVHPKALTAWEIHMPCSAFEVDVDKLLEIYQANP